MLETFLEYVHIGRINVVPSCVTKWLQMYFSNFELELLSFILAFFNKNILENQEITILWLSFHEHSTILRKIINILIFCRYVYKVK